MLYALALGAGLGLRLGTLGVQPLSTEEAASSWIAWLAATAVTDPLAEGVRTVFTPTSPLLYSLQSLFFWLAGGGDAVARAPSMIAGGVMVLLPWWLRPYLGRGVALSLAFLIAVDPWLVAYSRLADGAILSACFGLLTLIGLMHLLVPRTRPPRDASMRQGWLWITAIGGGLLAVSGLHAWNFVPVLLLFWGVLAWTPRPRSTHSERVDGSESVATNAGVGTSGLDGGAMSWALALFAGAAICGATGWLARPEGLGYISTSMTAWVRQFVSAEPVYSPGWVLLRLLVDQPLVIPFGLAGLIYLWSGTPDPVRRYLPRWALFLTLWTLWGVILLAVPGRSPLSLLMLGLPLLFATAHAVDAVVRHFQAGAFWRETSVLYSALTILVVSGIFWAVAVVSRPQFDVPLARISLVLGVLAVLLVVLYALWVNAQQALLAAAFYVGCLWFLATVSSSWQLNVEFDRMQPDGFFADVTDPDVRNLVENISTLSAQRVGDPDQLPLLVEMNGVPDPLLGWYLREMRSLTWTPALTIDAELPANALLISHGGTLSSQISANYMGDAYAVRTVWLPTAWLTNSVPSADSPENVPVWTSQWSARIQPLLRWIFYREIKQLPPSEQVVLWAQPS